MEATTLHTRRRAFVTAVAAAIMFALAGCAPANRSPAPTSAGPSDAEALVVLALGDSIPYNSPDDCPGCTGFVESYATALTDARGEEYTAVNRSRHDGATTAMILEQVESGGLDDALSDASIVVVSAGFNDQAPFGPDSACFLPDVDLDTVEGAAAAFAATTSECFATHNATTGESLKGLLEGVRARAPEAVILALTSYDSWTGWPDLDALGAETAGAVSAKAVEGLDGWRTIVCDEAVAVGGECVDLLAAFNGPEGGEPSGDLLAGDYTHPSQSGNDRIRDALLAVEG